MPFPPTFTDNWDITQPPDTQAANLLGQDIRNLKLDVMQRISLLSGTTANMPTPETVNATWGGTGYGLIFFATDSGRVYQWSGAVWVDITASIGSGFLATSSAANPVSVGGAAPPATGQVLTALTATTASWQTPAASPMVAKYSDSVSHSYTNPNGNQAGSSITIPASVLAIGSIVKISARIVSNFTAVSGPPNYFLTIGGVNITGASVSVAAGTVVYDFESSFVVSGLSTEVGVVTLTLASALINTVAYNGTFTASVGVNVNTNLSAVGIQTGTATFDYLGVTVFI